MNMQKSVRSVVVSAGMLLAFSALIGCASTKGPVTGCRDGAAGPSGPGAPVLAFEVPPVMPSAPSGDTSVDKPQAVASAGEEACKPFGDEEEEIGDQASLDAALELVEASRESWVDGDGDKALEALDRAHALIAQVEPYGDPKLIQGKEDLRFTISKRILEIYASRFTTVNGSHKAIPLAVNQHVEREIRSFQTKERGFFMEAYKRSGGYRGEIVKALKEAGLPEELSWLPLIESGFKVNALSRARALGLWQFIPSTGYKFGLMRNDWIDERMDPAKSTAAAIAYLKELHQIFGDWATVLAAYNCGEGTVLRAIRKQKINYLDNFWDLYERLPNETARYYPRFLAVLAILKEPARYGMTLEAPDKPRQCEVITVDKRLDLKAVAKRLGCPPGDLVALNPELRRSATPGVPYSLMVPEGKGGTSLAGLSEMPNWSTGKRSPIKRSYRSHRVKQGETLSRLASRYRTSIRAIADTNNMRRDQVIRVGQTLKIPLKGV